MTNAHTQAFDRAVTDRVDEVVELDLPSLEERVQLLKLYFTQFVVWGYDSSVGWIRSIHTQHTEARNTLKHTCTH